MNFEQLKKELPPLIGRTQVEKFFPGVLNARTLANLNCRGLGPRYIKRGRKIFYHRDDLLRWIFGNALTKNTSEQSWNEEL